jgi:hypothetical protein
VRPLGGRRADAAGHPARAAGGGQGGVPLARVGGVGACWHPVIVDALRSVSNDVSLRLAPMCAHCPTTHHRGSSECPLEEGELLERLEDECQSHQRSCQHCGALGRPCGRGGERRRRRGHGGDHNRQRRTRRWRSRRPSVDISSSVTHELRSRLRSSSRKRARSAALSVMLSDVL